MATWRPEGWNNPFDIEGWDSYGYYNAHQLSHVAFESGADALLDALLNQTSHPQEVRDSDGKKLGILVFIPNDEGD